jgi:glycosyltransferase involved in cell wall biosynthesis
VEAQSLNRIKITLTGEGTYPYVTGGVSTWADLLVKELGNIDFTIMPILMHPYVKSKFELPNNVVKVVKIPLWGTEEPTEYVKESDFSLIYQSKLRTLQEINEQKKLISIINILIDFIYGIEKDYDKLGDVILDFHNFFHTYDYHESFRSIEVWEAYKKKMSQIFELEEEDLPSVHDMIEGLRLLYRFFITLLAPVEESDIYHSSAAAFCGLPCVIAKKKYGSKFLLTEHGIYVREQYLYTSRIGMPPRTKEFLLGMISMIVKLNYHFADVISPVCDYNKRWELAWNANPNKLYTIYNGVDTFIFKKMLKKFTGRQTVVMVARIDPLKDIESYIRTCEIVRQKIPNILFKLYGPTVDKKYYEKCYKLYEELELQENFEFSGLTNSPAQAYNEGDVVMLTSISEAFPFVVIEAMACEKVVVSSDVGGTKEVLEGYGYVVRQKDIDGFADAVLKVLQNPQESHKMEILARQKVLKGFTIEDMIHNYQQLYKSLYQERIHGGNKSRIIF